MSLLQTITDIFESIFKRSSPEVQKKQQMKKLEQEIRDYIPVICRNGLLQPNFGEAIFTLYKCTRPLDNLFMVTIGANDIPRQHRFEAQLITTCYSAESQEIITSLSYENRKQEILSEKNEDREYLHQRKQLEKVIKELNSDAFKRIDKDILDLRRFVEFCNYNFIPFLQSFDSCFIPADFSYKPTYKEISITKFLNLLEDLYFQTSDLHITNVMGNAILAVAQLKKGSDLTEQESESIMSNLKKINFILTRVISPDKLKALIRLAKQEITFEPRTAVYTGSPKQEFANMLQQRFDADEQRIKTEIQDERISDDLAVLFSGIPLEELTAYNQNYNSMLQAESSLSFTWVQPLRILKTFLMLYITPGVKALLDDIVIEGFFNNSNYKTTFSTLVYSVINADTEMEAFEKSFGNDQKNSISVLESYIKDSKKDKDFYKRLEKMVLSINHDAHKLLQSMATNLFGLYKELGELLADSKKPSSEIIQNLKVLMMSSRNRENTNNLEMQYPNWKVFFDIMKNYVIINSGEMNG